MASVSKRWIMKKMSRVSLWNLKIKIPEHFKNKSLKTHYFKDFSRTTYNSRTIQGIQGIQEQLNTLQTMKFGHLIQKLSEYLPSMKLDDYSFKLHQERVDK